MKKILIVLVIVMVLFLVKNNYNVTEDAIRFRVIANSNNPKDIIMKEKVVNELSDIIFKKNNNKEETRNNIIKNLNEIEKKVDNLFKINNYNINYNIMYGLNYFPEKKLSNKTYPAGEYESLVIEIGEAKGNNYWCILYPPLCTIDEDIDKSEKIEYKFKIIELINNLF